MRNKTRVVILGAGPSGLAAAWGLSRTEKDRDRYDVVVYQMGWQAGGHCSTGRVPPTMRIDQNGTHYLFGCYDTALGLVRHAYDQLAEDNVTDFGTFEEQLSPRNRIVLTQYFKGQWTKWALQVPTNRVAPGSPVPQPTPMDLVGMMLQGVVELVLGWEALGRMQECGLFPGPRTSPPSGPLGKLCLTLDTIRRFAGHRLIQLALDLFTTAARDSRLTRAALDLIAWILDEVRNGIRCAMQRCIQDDIEALRTWILVDLGVSTIVGMIRDNAIADGFDVLDQWDYREWLQRHGASDEAVWSPLTAAWYNAIASYVDGEVSKPDTSAATTMRGIFLLLFGYKGAFAYQLVWEVGDGVIGPIFETLRRRGVRFRFFQRIRELTPAADARTIERIRIEQQVEVRNGQDSYEPFVPWRGRKVWPDCPRYEQLVDPITDNKHIYREFYTGVLGREYEIERGRDFDHVVYAMPLGMVRFVAPQLMAQKPDTWGTMIAKLQTVETRSVRLWWRDDLKDLGWPYGLSIVSGFVQPFNTWEDQSDVLQTEEWPPNQQPKMECTVFGPMPGPVDPPPESDTDYPRRKQALAEESARVWLENNATQLWPNAVDITNPPALDWNSLVEFAVRSNAGPIESYIVCAAGTLQYRLAPDESGYDNLWLAGDWTRNGLDIGSVEGAFRSGLQAADALSKFPIRHYPAP